MKLARHLSKGAWAFALKALPAVNGVASIFLVVRSLPAEEYGAFALVQTLYLFTIALVNAFALLPVVRFIAGRERTDPYATAGLLLTLCFLLGVTGVLWALPASFWHLVNIPPLAVRLFPYLPALFAASGYRLFAVALLQPRYRLREMFFIEAVANVGTPAAVGFLLALGSFTSAEDLLRVMVLMQLLSSLTAMGVSGRLFQWTLDRGAVLEIFRFGKYVFSGSVFYSVFSQLDVVFVTSFGGLVAAATYSAAKVFVRIFDLLGQVLQVFAIPFSSRKWEAGDRTSLQTVAEKLVAFSTILLLPVGAIMALIPSEALLLLYNGKYLDGAIVVRVLSILAIVTPWNAVGASYFIGTGKVKTGFWVSVLLVSVALPLYWTLTPRLGPAGTAIAYAFSQAVTTVVVVLILRRSVPLSIRGVLGRWRDIRQLLRDWTTRLLQAPPGES